MVLWYVFSMVVQTRPYTTKYHVITFQLLEYWHTYYIMDNFLWLVPYHTILGRDNHLVKIQTTLMSVLMMLEGGRETQPQIPILHCIHGKTQNRGQSQIKTGLEASFKAPSRASSVRCA